jgi:hypothetical protein
VAVVVIAGFALTSAVADAGRSSRTLRAWRGRCAAHVATLLEAGRDCIDSNAIGSRASAMLDRIVADKDRPPMQPRCSRARHALLPAALAAMLAGCSQVPPAPAPAPPPIARAMLITCELPPPAAAGASAGWCDVPCSVNALAVNFDGVDAKRACSAPDRRVNASLAPTAVTGRWLGTMQGVQPEDPTRFEVVPDKAGAGSVARMPYGWFRVTELQRSDTVTRLMVDASRQVRPTTDDLAIIDRAVALMPDAQRWNKNDNRECPAGAPKLSLFCALMQATTEVSGGVHYRQPAMQAVREELNRVDAARIKTHRIMDYNNHPDTTLQEVHGLLQKARTRVAAEIRQ